MRLSRLHSGSRAELGACCFDGDSWGRYDRRGCEIREDKEYKMKINIRSYADAGDLANERLVLNVLEDTDIGNYAILKSSISNTGGATWGSKVAYWFPNKEVKKGDLVVLYTKNGTSSSKELRSGGIAYFYYWKRDSAIWGGSPPQSVAVLLEAPHWHVKERTDSN